MGTVPESLGARLAVTRTRLIDGNGWRGQQQVHTVDWWLEFASNCGGYKLRHDAEPGAGGESTSTVVLGFVFVLDFL